MTPSSAGPSRRKLISAFAAVYLIWGSTFLAIRYAIDTLPPFLMAGTRHIIAGTLLYIWTRASNKERLERKHWVAAFVVGGLLLACGNGAVAWAEQRVPSGLTALLIATVPIWMVLIDSLQHRVRPGRQVIFALLLGFAGLALLVGPGRLMGAERVNPMGAGVLFVGSLCWASGSLYARKAPLASGLLGTAMQMLAGGILLFPLSLATGEWHRFSVARISMPSVAAFVYLIAFGSLIGFTAYVWLLSHASPARASTYAYVNPVVAVFLGWIIAGEHLSPRILLAAAIIVSAVALIITDPHKQRRKLSGDEEASERQSGKKVESEMVGA